MPTEVTLTIDGQEITVPHHATIFQAARSVGIEIPHLCYDPDLGLEPTSSCRLCVVEVEGAKALAASCSHPVAPGMVVHTDTESLRDYRRMILELLLSDHPQDCLTCEKCGDCSLQKYAYEFGVRGDVYGGEHAAAPLEEEAPTVVYDRSKCILCGRCVQVCHNVQVAGAVDFLDRGFHARIGLPPGLAREDSACEGCGNCIDVCPTGALFFPGAERGGRTWELRRTVTICPYCGVGCTIILHTRNNRVVAVTGEPGLGVNRGRLCVKGRFGFDFLGHEDRLTQPLLRRDGELVPVSWDEALDFCARRLAEIKQEYGPDAIAGLASAKCTNEEDYLMQKFMRAVIGTNNIDHCARLCHASTVAGLAQAFGSGAMTNSIDDLDQAGAIFVIGSNTTECHPLIGAAIKRAAQRGVPLIVADPRNIELTDYATVHLRQRHGTDVALINALARVILEEGLEDREFIASRTENFEAFRAAVEPYTPELVERITGVPAEDIIRAARLYAQPPGSPCVASAEQGAAIFYSMGITQHTCGTDNVLALANLALLTGNLGKPGAGVNPLRGQNNVQGACDVGALPNVYPGYQAVDDEALRAKFEAAWGVALSPTPGLTMVEMTDAAAEGKLKALYVMGENPMMSDPDVGHVEKALRNLDLLIVQDIFLTDTAQLADVVLPAAGFAEKEGTFTNTERRVQRVRQALEPPGLARPDWQTLCDLACRLGYEMSYSGPAAVQDEIASLTPSYAGITYDRLEPLAQTPSFVPEPSAVGRGLVPRPSPVGHGLVPRPLPVAQASSLSEPPSAGLQWPCPSRDHPGTPILHTEKFPRGLGKFHPVHFLPPQELPDADYPFVLSTGRILQHFHTGTMTRRSQVLDTLVSEGSIEIHPLDAARLGIADDELVRISSRRGQIEIRTNITERVLPGTVFLAFHYREAPANALTIAALDPVAKIPEFKVCAVQVTRTVAQAPQPASGA
jgi:formate dehydrogenase alpha subunit